MTHQPVSDSHSQRTKAEDSGTAAASNSAGSGYKLPPHPLISRNLEYVLSSIPELPLQFVRSWLISSTPTATIESRTAVSSQDEAAEHLSFDEALLQRQAGLSPAQRDAILELTRALSLSLASPASESAAQTTPTSHSDFDVQPMSTWLNSTQPTLNNRLLLASSFALLHRLPQARSELEVARSSLRAFEKSTTAAARKKERGRIDVEQGAVAGAQGDEEAKEAVQEDEHGRLLKQVKMWQARLLLALANVATLQGNEGEAKRFLGWREKALGESKGSVVRT